MKDNPTIITLCFRAQSCCHEISLNSINANSLLTENKILFFEVTFYYHYTVYSHFERKKK